MLVQVAGRALEPKRKSTEIHPSEAHVYNVDFLAIGHAAPGNSSHERGPERRRPARAGAGSNDKSSKSGSHSLDNNPRVWRVKRYIQNTNVSCGCNACLPA
jgi:hypothetical protein